MRRRLLSLVLATLALVTIAPALHAQERFAVHAERMIDGTSNAARGPVWVIVNGDRIESVETSAPSGLDVVDLGGATLLPGLIDLHTHISSRVGVPRHIRQMKDTPARIAVTATVNAEKTLLGGFTTVRDVGGRGLADVAVRDAINEGEIPGPRMQVATFSISMTGGHGDPLGGVSYLWCRDFPDGVADGTDEVRKQVRMNLRNGADVIKFHATGGVLSPRDDPRHTGFSMEEMETIVEEAHRQERHVAAHCHGKEGAIWASNAGVTSLEHVTYMDDEAAKVLQKNGTWYIPTLYVVEPIIAEGNPLKIPDENLAKTHVVKDHMKVAFKAALRNGVKVGFGTDAGVFEHGTQGKEFALYVGLGMKPMDAIRSATGRAAECMGWEDRVGSIAPGRFADLIAVSGDPLRNIEELETVDWVMKGGKVYRDDLTP